MYLIQIGTGHTYIPNQNAVLFQQQKAVELIYRGDKNNVQPRVFVQKPTLYTSEFCSADKQVLRSALQNKQVSQTQSH